MSSVRISDNGFLKYMRKYTLYLCLSICPNTLRYLLWSNVFVSSPGEKFLCFMLRTKKLLLNIIRLGGFTDIKYSTQISVVSSDRHYTDPASARVSQSFTLVVTKEDIQVPIVHRMGALYDMLHDFLTVL